MKKGLGYRIKTVLIIFLMMVHSANAKISIYSESMTYAGEYVDSESGLQYLKARYYLPKTMRFISRDSVDLTNRYSYADSDPINKKDPSGHIGENILAKLGEDVTHLFGQIVNKNFQLPLNAVKKIGQEQEEEAAAAAVAVDIFVPEEAAVAEAENFMPLQAEDLAPSDDEEDEVPAHEAGHIGAHQGVMAPNQPYNLTVLYQNALSDDPEARVNVTRKIIDNNGLINMEHEENPSRLAYNMEKSAYLQGNFQRLADSVYPGTSREINFGFLEMQPDGVIQNHGYNIKINENNEVTEWSVLESNQGAAVPVNQM